MALGFTPDRYRSPYATPPIWADSPGPDPVAAALAPGVGVPSPAPFVWGEGGSRYTPEQVAAMRDDAQAQIAEAGSGAPVAHWLQGLNRSLGAVTGGLEMRRARKADEANRAHSDEVLQALLDGEPDKRAVLAAMADPNLSPEAQGAAKTMAGSLFAKPAAPHYWETNNGSLGMIGPDGKPVIVYNDPTPKVDWITADNGDGTKTLTPIVNGQMGGGGQASGAPQTTAPPAEAIAALKRGEGTPEQFDEMFGPGAAARAMGGGAGNGTGGFPR